ncbi:MAG: transcriptional repressor LexA [Clostridia bacterium]|nr:transcriptional repressor LexA [Clostridia bacterium]MBQ9996628.1 transcriptional repressor LexA [Clostridia bacterium]
MTKLSPKEQLVFDYIKENIKTRGYSPSIRDICAALNIKSTSTVHTCLERLEEKGYIQKEDGKSRTVRIEGLNTADAAENPDSLSIPIIGRVTAGTPILAVENYEGYIHYPAGLRSLPENEMFALRVSGNSMIEAGILDGDIVIVEKTPIAENGDIVVALIDDEATVKTFYKEDGHFRLQPENRAMLPIIVNSLMILGKVITSIRYYR